MAAPTNLGWQSTHVAGLQTTARYLLQRAHVSGAEKWYKPSLPGSMRIPPVRLLSGRGPRRHHIQFEYLRHLQNSTNQPRGHGRTILSVLDTASKTVFDSHQKSGKPCCLLMLEFGSVFIGSVQAKLRSSMLTLASLRPT